MSEVASGESAWNKARIEALSDGIFAIAMTLLVLEIKVPDLPRHSSASEVWRGIGEHGMIFFSFFITFLLSGLFWFWHHVSFHYIRRVDGVILAINLVFLMFVSLLPFSTALLGSFTLGQPVSLAFYFANQLALSLTLNAHWRYALARGYVERTTSPVVERLSAGLFIHPVACTGSLLMLFVEPRQAFKAFLFVQMFGVVIARIVRRRRSKA